MQPFKITRLQPRHFDLRPLPSRTNNINNRNNNLVPVPLPNRPDNNNRNNNLVPVPVPPANNMGDEEQAVREVRIVERGARAVPNTFYGDSSSNGAIWFDKFVSHCIRNEIPDDQCIHEFKLLIGGACENWFAMLPQHQKDTFAHLSQAFMREYANPDASIAEKEYFYNKKQQYAEPALTYIESMVKLGNKLQLNADEILRTTRRGLLPDLYMYLLDKNIVTMTELKQKVQLREMTCGVNDQVSHNKVHFAANTQNNTDILQASIEKLTNVVDKLHISALSTTQLNTRPRPSSPFAYNNDAHNDSADAHINQQSVAQPYCSKCLCSGHLAHQCRVMQQPNIPPVHYDNQIYDQTSNRYSNYTPSNQQPYQTSYYRPRYNESRPNGRFYNQNNRYVRPQYESNNYRPRNTFYNQRSRQSDQQYLN